MGARISVDEENGCYVTLDSTDEAGNPLVPALLRYRVDDLSNARAILAWTGIPGPSASTRITIPSALNVMDTTRLRPREIRRVTFELTAPDGLVSHPYADYDLIRLSTVP